MNIVKPYAQLINHEDPQMHIEVIGRTCYKSENKITEASNRSFIAQLYKSKHWAMLEHFIFIYDVTSMSCDGEEYLEISAPGYNVSSAYVDYNSQRNVISFNATAINNLYEKFIKTNDRKQYLIKRLIDRCIWDYDCHELFGKDRDEYKIFNDSYIEDLEPLKINDLILEEQKIHAWQTVKFVCDRGVSHELVRHRIASFAQESTRYCNYSKDKFGNEITVIKPIFFDNYCKAGDDDIQYNMWHEAMIRCEKLYFQLLKTGAKPQEARSVLPNSLKTEVIMTAKLDEWNHFFGLRVDTPAHPQMRELTIPLYMQFKSVFGDAVKNNYLDELLKASSK